MFRNSNVFLHDKISGLYVRWRIESIQESRMVHRERYQRLGDILNAGDTFVSPSRDIDRDASIATRQISSLIPFVEGRQPAICLIIYIVDYNCGYI